MLVEGAGDEGQLELCKLEDEEAWMDGWMW